MMKRYWSTPFGERNLNVAAWKASYKTPQSNFTSSGTGVSKETPLGEGHAVGEKEPVIKGRDLLRPELSNDLDEEQVRTLEQIRERREKSGRK